MSYDHAVPRSLVKPDGSRAQQALFTAITVANGAPSDSSTGLQTGNRRNLHLFATELTGDTAVSVTLHVWGRVRGGQWGRLYIVTASGAVSGLSIVLESGTKLWTIVNIGAVDEVYVEALDFTDASVSAWGYTNDGAI